MSNRDVKDVDPTLCIKDFEPLKSYNRYTFIAGGDPLPPPFRPVGKCFVLYEFKRWGSSRLPLLLLLLLSQYSKSENPLCDPPHEPLSWEISTLQRSETPNRWFVVCAWKFYEEVPTTLPRSNINCEFPRKVWGGSWNHLSTPVCYASLYNSSSNDASAFQSYFTPITVN